MQPRLRSTVREMVRESAKRSPAAKRTERARVPAGKTPSARVRGSAAPAARASDSQRNLPETRAPGRGKYDRSRSSGERQKEQMQRLLEAATVVFSETGWADATV